MASSGYCISVLCSFTVGAVIAVNSAALPLPESELGLVKMKELPLFALMALASLSPLTSPLPYAQGAGGAPLSCCVCKSLTAGPM